MNSPAQASCWRCHTRERRLCKAAVFFFFHTLLVTGALSVNTSNPTGDPILGTYNPLVVDLVPQNQTLVQQIASGLNYTYRVCISSWAPFVFYNPVTNTHTGYDWDVFTAVQGQMGFAFVSYETASWDEMMSSLALSLDDPNHCDIAPTGIPYDNYAFSGDQECNLVQFNKISIPTFRGGFGMAVKVIVGSTDIWAWLKVFSWDLWGVIIGAALILGCLVYAAEYNFHAKGLGKVRYPTNLRAGLYEGFYRLLGKLFNVVSDLEIVSMVSKIISISWGIATIVLIANYTASLAGFITAVNIDYQVTDVSQLPGTVAGTYVAAAPRLNKHFNLNLSQFVWNTDQDGIDALDLVASGKWSAMLMDTPWLRYYLAKRCDVAIVGPPLIPDYLGHGFNRYMPQAFIDKYNQALLNLQAQGYQEMVEAAWLPASTCTYGSGTATTFTLRIFAGLFIFIAAALGLSLLQLALPHISSKLEMDVPLARSSRSFSIAGHINEFREHSLVARTLTGIWQHAKRNKVGQEHTAAGDSELIAVGKKQNETNINGSEGSEDEVKLKNVLTLGKMKDEPAIPNGDIGKAISASGSLRLSYGKADAKGSDNSLISTARPLNPQHLE